MHRNSFSPPARTTRYVLLLLALGIGMAATPHVAALAAAGRASTDALHIAHTAPTARGRYTVTLIVPRPVELGGQEAWHLRIRDRDGAPVREADVAVDGWNTDAGHGFSSAPRVSWTHVDRYRVETGRSRTPGRWVLTTRVLGPAGADSVVFAFHLH